MKSQDPKQILLSVASAKNYFSCYVDDCSHARTAAITSVLRRLNRDCWRINASFTCPSLLSSRGRMEVAWLGQQCHLLDEMVLSHSASPLVYQYYATQALPKYFKTKEHHYQASRPFSGNCKEQCLFPQFANMQSCVRYAHTGLTSL